MNDEEDKADTDASRALYEHILDKVVAEKIPPRATLAALTGALISCAQAAEVSPKQVLENVGKAVARATGGKCTSYVVEVEQEPQEPPS